MERAASPLTTECFRNFLSSWREQKVDARTAYVSDNSLIRRPGAAQVKFCRHG
jgi:hypothetical protein